jgi:hypothetical protein
MTAVHGGEGAMFQLANEDGPGQSEPAAMQELRGLVDRARRGDDAALPRLRAIFDEHPAVAVWLGNLAHHAQEELIRLAAGADLGMAEAVRRSAAALSLELTGPAPTVIERLLAERVVATRLFLGWIEATGLQALGVETNTRAQLAFFLDRTDRAERRHLAALGALMTAQRLLPAAKAPSAPPAAERALGQPGASSEGRAIGAVADGDDRLGPDHQAREPEGLVMFAGDGGHASPATKAHRARGRRRGAAS